LISLTAKTDKKQDYLLFGSGYEKLFLMNGCIICVAVIDSKFKTKMWQRRFPYNQSRVSKRLVIVALIALSLIAVLSLGVYVIAQQMRSRLVVVNGATITVKSGGEFQTALDKAKPGDTIVLEAGATYKGSFTLPNKTGAEFITIRSSANDSQLPAQNQRIDPAKHASVLPKLVSSSTDPVIKTAAGAHHYRFIGIEFGPTQGGYYNIIRIGEAEEKSVEDLPHHIEFDRVYIHGSPTDGQRRGIAANGRHIRIINSHISDIKRKGEESAAIGVWGSDGALEIVNNYIEAAGIGVLLGGAYNPNLNLVVADVVVRDNHFNKPLEWRDEGWVVKNIFEIKSGKRVKVTNNLMTNNWGGGQGGTAILFTVREDSGPNAVIEDVEFTDNLVRSSGGAVSVYGDEVKGGRRLTIRNNVFDDIDGTKWEGAGQFLLTNGWDNLVVENNTVIQTGNITKAYGKPVTNFIFRNNIVFNNDYGFHGDSRAPGQDSVDFYFPKSLIDNNAIIGGDGRLKSRNMYPASILELKFINPKVGDYRPQPNSPLKKKGANGMDIGANLDPMKVGKNG